MAVAARWAGHKRESMPMQVVAGALLRCSMGSTPSMLVVLPVNRTLASGPPAATILDHVPLLNILPFGVCSSLANPQVAATTAAALGVLTPQPCIPATPAPWVPGAPTVLIGGVPALDDACHVMCLWAGVIQVTFPGQTTVIIP
jgi:hypothetical protein